MHTASIHPSRANHVALEVHSTGQAPIPPVEVVAALPWNWQHTKHANTQRHASCTKAAQQPVVLSSDTHQLSSGSSAPVAPHLWGLCRSGVSNFQKAKSHSGGCARTWSLHHCLAHMITSPGLGSRPTKRLGVSISQPGSTMLGRSRLSTKRLE